MNSKKPLIAENPIEAVLQKQGVIKAPESGNQTAEPADQSAAPKAEDSKIQLLALFGDYGVPFRVGTGSRKSKRVQLLLYPEEQAKAAETAKKLGVSFNDLAAAALNKICRDYEEQER